MIDTQKRIDALIHFGEKMREIFEDNKLGKDPELKEIFTKARAENPWFTEKNIILALKNWLVALEPGKLEKWAGSYAPVLDKNRTAVTIAVINAGNIPFVGLHDLLSVIISGNNYIGKNATGDTILLPYIASVIGSVEPAFGEQINFVSRLEKMDAVIATGNNNSSRYFEYYFGKYPNIIRKNRNGVGVLHGKESNDQLHALGNDIFSYFGLGCRNVSKLYVPEGYDFTKFFEAIEDFHEVKMHNKYMNNFEYNNSILLLKRVKFLQNGFLIVRRESQIASPVSVLHFEEYDQIAELEKNLLDNIERIQCIAVHNDFFSGNEKLENLRVEFGKTQSPELWDYADGIDTVRFLTEL